MLIGPVLSRELTTAPRNWRSYFARALYAAALFGLALTAWIVIGIGSQPVRTLGDVARFGSATFALIAPVQMALATAFAALLTAAAVAQEKDRRTLDLLLMSRMTGSELVLGRLGASLVSIFSLVAAGIGVLMLLRLLGGISQGQVNRVVGVTLASALAAGSMGSTIALWREKTFQTLATTALALVLWLLVGETLAVGAWGGWLDPRFADWAAAVSPLRAIVSASSPTTGLAAIEASSWPGGVDVLGTISARGRLLGVLPTDASLRFILFSLAGSAVLNLWAIARVRVWNPSREVQLRTSDDHDGKRAVGGDVHAAPGKTREVWDNPILWREIRTWAYGKKIVFVRVAYLALFVACAAAVAGLMSTDVRGGRGEVPPLAQPILPLAVLGLVLVNALAVTSLTNERDLRALDLLLVTDLTPKEIIFGKLTGVFYNSKEIILLPLALCGALWWTGRMTGESYAFLICGQLVMTSFVAMLGVHAGMMYANSRSAVGVSLGTVLFLLLGIAVCMRMMVAFHASFQNQLWAFAAFIVGGGVGLYCAIGAQRESPALVIASGAAPFATFFALTSFLKGNFGAAMLVTLAAYGFATAAMLVPALYEFDVATGRTTARDL